MNNQQIYKIVNFFRINHQFHDPYQFILDGNFLKIVVQKQLDLQRKLENAIQGRVTLRVTSCILRQLQLLGQQFRLVLEEAKKHKTIYCKHPLQHSVDECILEQVGSDNEKNYFVCSQDIALRRRLRQLQKVPIVYFGPDQRVTMQDINKSTLKNIEKQAYRKYLPQGKEVQQVEQYKKEQQILEKQRKIKELSSQQGIKIKTKIAKGPNPLSVKKKQKKQVIIQKPQHNEASQAQQSEGQKKRKRIRKRNRNKKDNVQQQQNV